MTFTQLQYAIALQKYGSFKQAASKLEITQPALSLQISKLERDLELSLFDRTHSPIKPTTEGYQFLLRAREIVGQMEELQAFAAGFTEKVSGKLKIGIIPTLAPFLVPLFADSLQKDHPGISLDIHEQITNQVIHGVRHGDLDAGIISTPLHINNMVSIPLFYEKFMFYTSYETHDRTIQLSTVDYQKLWLLNEGNCFRDQINNFCNLSEIRKNKSFVYRSNSIDALIRIVDTKGGYTILPELTTLSLTEEQEENLRPIADKPFAREIGLIIREKNNKQILIDQLAECIRANIPKPMLSPEGLNVVDPDIHVEE